MVRKPDWAPLTDIQLSKRTESGADAPLPVSVQGRWLHLGTFHEAAEVHVKMPDDVSTHTDIIHDFARKQDVRFTTRWRGNAVLSIEPAGTRRPNYARREARAWQPYVPQHTAATAFDPVAMTPPYNTAEPMAGQ